MVRVTVGIPVYNNANTLEDSIYSVLKQSYKDYKVLLSDDGSSDDSWKICQTLAANNVQIRAFKQIKNLYYLNFKFLLDKADTEYFCWLAGDDLMYPEYLEKAVQFLDENPTYSGVVGVCEFINQDEKLSLAKGTYAIPESSPNERLQRYFNFPSDNTRMYGVYRTAILKKCMPSVVFHAWDYALSALSLWFGKHGEINQPLLRRLKTEESRYREMVKRDSENWFFSLFPLLRMSLYLRSKIDFKQMPNARRMLISLNVYHHRLHMEYHHPRLYKKISWLYRFYDSKIKWRLK